jgi:uncharacterized membrane protein YjjB (DUF3815 family)
MINVLWGLVQMALWAGVAATGFGIFFNVPRRVLPALFFCGTSAFIVRAALMQFGLLGIEAGTLIAGIVAGLLALAFGRMLHVPVLVIVIPSVIPFVPGALAFRTAANILVLVTENQQPDTALLVDIFVNGMRTLLIVGAIAVGATFPTLLFRRHRPMM